jgi:hypothetical protein
MMTRTIVKLEWHKPKTKTVIRVPKKKNTWSNFFKIISERRTPPTVYPGFEIIQTSVYENRVGSRKRMGELRVREREAKNTRRPLNRVRFRQVPLPEWATKKIEAGLKTKRDPKITDREWERLINRAIAEIVVSRLKNI